MKDLSALEISYVVKELSILENAKLDKIYNPKKTEFVFRFHVKDHGKKILRILLPHVLYLTTTKQDYPNPSAFCMYLRKRLENTRVTISQKRFERIIEIVCSGRETHIVILEFFGKGNLIICNEKYEILSALEAHVWKARTIKKGETYQYPPQDYNPFDLTYDEFIDLLRTSSRESIVKTLAMDLGLGGTFAEEVCALAKVDKTRKRLTDEEKKSIHKTIKSLKNKKITALVIDEKEALPYPLIKFKNAQSEEFKTFNEALDNLLSKEVQAPKQNPQLKKIQTMIKKQESAVKKMQQQEKESRAKAELIYANYQLISEIFAEIKKAREKYSWKEIKEKLKGHKIIKDINEKEGKIIMEL